MNAAIQLESPSTEITSNKDSALALRDGSIFKNRLTCATETLFYGLLLIALDSMQGGSGQM